MMPEWRSPAIVAHAIDRAELRGIPRIATVLAALAEAMADDAS